MTPEEQPDKDLIRRQKQQLVVNAYHRVFGTSKDTRNAEQRLVWDDLNKCFGFDAAAFTGPDYNTHKAAIRDGQRQVHLHIETMLKRPVLGDDNLKPKTKVIKE